MSGRVLIVDDDADNASMLRGALRRRGYEADVAGSGPDALGWLEQRPANLVLAHLGMRGVSGVDLCASLRERHPDLATIVVTGSAAVENAISAIRAGAYDYLTKPIDLEALVIAIERAIGHVTLCRELLRLREQAEAHRPGGQIVGDSPAIRKVIEVVGQVADSDASVLILGESGTGKEVIARALHRASSRRDQPFAAVNCAAMPPGLLESELFGHVKGAFTDARCSRPGLFARAQGGTLLLDEIGEMPPAMQVKLLRVLQERCVRPVGGEEETPFDVRLICATHRNLEQDVVEKRFREDLFYRINVVQVAVPPLRARGGDVLVLAHHFLRKIAARTGTPVVGLSPEAARALVEYEWPGNVRELENCLERAIALRRADEIAVGDLPAKVQSHRRAIAAAGLPDELIPLAEVETRYVQQVLSAVGGDRVVAARILGIDRRSLHRRLDGETTLS